MEIAAMLDISVGTSKSSLFKARNILQPPINKIIRHPNMQQGNEHIDDLFRKAADHYPLNTKSSDWENSTKNLAVIQVFI